MIDTSEAEPSALYSEIVPVLPLGLPFLQTAVCEDWFDWPALPDLFQRSFPGVKTSRDSFLVDIDLDRLKARIADYFDPTLDHDEIASRYPSVMKSTSRFDARAVRDSLMNRDGPDDEAFIPFAYRPFDNRWLFWEGESGLLDRPRTDYRPHVFEGNLWLSAAQHLRKGAEEPQSCSTNAMGSLHLIERGALMFPAWVLEDGKRKPNLREPKYSGDWTVKHYLARLGLGVEDLFFHVIATLHDRVYRQTNSGALAMEWPRIPLPGWPHGKLEGAAQSLVESATHGRKLAALLDSEASVLGVTHAPLRPEFATLAVPATVSGRNMAGKDFAVTVGWGHHGQSQAVIPGQGNAVERDYSTDERVAVDKALHALGESTLDVHLNANAFWRNVPAAVWNYKLGGYQVLKKWLSYREQAVLGRMLDADEVQHFSDIVRRIAAILIATTGNTEFAARHSGT